MTPWTTARQTSLSITNSRSFLKLMSIESVMPSSHLIFCRLLLLLPSVFPSIRVFSNESALCIRWPKSLSFSSTLLLRLSLPLCKMGILERCLAAQPWAVNHHPCSAEPGARCLGSTGPMAAPGDRSQIAAETGGNIWHLTPAEN